MIGGVISYPESRKSIIKGSLISGIIGLVILKLFMAMGMVGTSYQVGRVLITPQKKLIALLPLFLSIEYGPMGIIFLFGIWKVIKEREIFHWPWFQAILATIVCLFFTLMIQHPFEPDIVQRKSGKDYTSCFITIFCYGFAMVQLCS